MKTLDDMILPLVDVCELLEINELATNLDYVIMRNSNYKVNIIIEIELIQDENETK